MNAIKEEMRDDQRKMTPQERLRAFVNHSRLMVQLSEAGERYRRRFKPRRNAK